MLRDGRGVVAEVKPRYYMALHKNLIKWPVLRAFCQLHGYGRLITDGRIAIQSYWQHSVPVSFAAALREAATIQPLSWREYRKIRDTYQATWTDFVATILQNNLVWILHPFRVQSHP